MNTKTIATLILGLVIGSLATQLYNNDSSTPKTSEVSSPPVKNEKHETTSESIVSNSESTHSNSTSTKIQKPADILMCLDHLKPSDITEWQDKWKKKVDQFMASSDLFWNSKGNRSFDKDQYPSSIGKYKGVWEVAGQSNLRINLSIELTSDIKGLYKIESSHSNGSSDGEATFRCWSDIIPKKDLGTDEKENALNFFMLNCNPTYLGSVYSQFAFKLPSDMSKNQQKRLEVYGLVENLDWKSMGFLDLVKLQ